MAAWLAVSVALGGLLFRSRTRKGENEMSPEDARQTIRAARRQVREMRHLAIRIPERDMRQETNGLADVASLILDTLEANPADIRRARRFLDYYLGAAVALIRRYVQLGEHRSASPEVEAAVARFSDVIRELRSTFDEQHTRLLTDQAFDFQVDADVLRKLMDLGGL